MGCKEKYVPCGIVDEDSGELNITFGSSYKTSDVIVDALEAKWDALDDQEKAATRLVQIKMDSGPESSGKALAIAPSDGAAARVYLSVQGYPKTDTKKIPRWHSGREELREAIETRLANVAPGWTLPVREVFR